MLNECAFPGCSCTNIEFVLGVAFYNKVVAEQIIGPVCQNHMRQSIEETMGKCIGTKLWVVVLNQTHKLVYHSYDADQNGFKAAYGWDLKYQELITP